MVVPYNSQVQYSMVLKYSMHTDALDLDIGRASGSWNPNSTMLLCLSIFQLLRHPPHYPNYEPNMKTGRQVEFCIYSHVRMCNPSRSGYCCKTHRTSRPAAWVTGGATYPCTGHSLLILTGVRRNLSWGTGVGFWNSSKIALTLPLHGRKMHFNGL